MLNSSLHAGLCAVKITRLRAGLSHDAQETLCKSPLVERLPRDSVIYLP